MSIAVDVFPEVAISHYDVIRPQLRSGDILLCSGNAFFSRLIQKATQSVWSHVAFILRLEAINRVMVLESVESIGVRTVPLSSYVRNYNGSGKAYPGRVLIARHSELKASEVPHLSQAAVNLLGYPYDKDEILRIAGRISTKAFGLGWKGDIAAIGQDRAYICSEYAYQCYESVGVMIDYDPAGFVSPADFAKTPAINAMNFLQMDERLPRKEEIPASGALETV